MFYPEFLREGSLIGICAPSAGVGYKVDLFDMSLEVLEDEGFYIAETDSVRNDDCPSAPAEIRGAEFNTLFEDEDVDFVFCASGGDYCVEMLPYIDEDIVRSNPKWFAGYSDPTAIEMLLTTKLDIATIYGVNAGAFDWRPLHEFHLDALSVLEGDLPLQHSFDFYNSTGFNEETEEYEMDAPVEWILLKGSRSDAFDRYGDYDDQSDENTDYDYEDQYDRSAPHYEFYEEYELDVTGRLIGGCIDVIDWVIGTPYEDLEGFVERYKDDGFIWFFDNFELTPMNLMYAATKMKLKGLFDNAKAVVFGRPCFRGDATDIDYLEQLERVFADLEAPVIWNADIGHTKPSFTLINGAIGHLSYDHGYAELTMELR